MLLSAVDALNLLNKPEHILWLYGMDRAVRLWISLLNEAEEPLYFFQKCLGACCLVERGVPQAQHGLKGRDHDSYAVYKLALRWGV